MSYCFLKSVCTVLKSLQKCSRTGPASLRFCENKTKREEESKRPGSAMPLTSFYCASFTVCSMVLTALITPLSVSRRAADVHLPLQNPACDDKYMHICKCVCVCEFGGVGGGVCSLAGKGRRSGSKAMCEGAGLPHRKQLPLAVSASHPDLTAARNMRPLQTSVLGKKRDQDSTHPL